MRQEVYFENIRNQIIQNLSSCEFELKIAVAWFTDKQIIKEINKLISDGVDVEIIIYDDHINQKELFKDLYHSNAKIWLSKKMMHNKFCVIDKRIIINGSYNWTNNARGNHENIQITRGNLDLCLSFIEEFKSLKRSCNKIDHFFDYSLDNLKDEAENAKYYISINSNNKKPYFYHEKEAQNNLEYKMHKFFNGFYFITSKEEEDSFFYLKYFLQSELNTSKALKFLDLNLQIPQRFEFVFNLKNYEDKYSTYLTHIYGHRLIVEQDRNLFSIDENGNLLDEKIKFNKKIDDNLYIINNMKSVEVISIGRYSEVSKKTLHITDVVYLKNLGYLGKKKISENLWRLGILDFSGKEIFPFIFQDYEIINSISEINLYEFPLFIWNDSNELLKLNNQHRFDKKKPYKQTNIKFSSKVKSTKYSSNDGYINKIYLSDEGDKYQELYLYIIEGIGKYRYNFLSELKERKLQQLKKTVDIKERPLPLLKTFEWEEHIFNEFRTKQESESKNNEGCYIATMVYENYDHPNVILLREFRDKKLNTYYLGKIFIKGYYRYSPKYVQFVKDKRFLHSFSRMVVKEIVKILKIML